MSGVSGSRYQCLLCSKMRDIIQDTVEHIIRVGKSPNGLALYSDVHRCDEGILGINNLHIDVNFAVRSFSAIELPEKRKPVSRPGIPGVPMATATSSTSSKLRQYTITHMLPEKGFRLIIEDGRLNVVINIGRIPKKEKPIQVVESDLGSIILDYYPSEMEYNTHMDQWLHILVNQLELLPVTRLGLFIETLRFIHSCYHSKPDEFQIKQLQTILTSHETYFKLTKPEESRLEAIDAKYGAELTSLMINIIKILTENPGFNLNEIALKLDRDLVYLIYTLLIMEQELLIEIKSPIITDT